MIFSVGQVEFEPLQPVFEAIHLLTPIKEAWESIADEARQFREDLAKHQRELANKAPTESSK